MLENFTERLNKINFSILNDTESKKAEKVIRETLKNRNVKIEELSKDKNGNFDLIIDFDRDIKKALKENLDNNVGRNVKFSIEERVNGLHIIPAKLNEELSRKYGKLLLPPRR